MHVKDFVLLPTFFKITFEDKNGVTIYAFSCSFKTKIFFLANFLLDLYFFFLINNIIFIQLILFCTLVHGNFVLFGKLL